MDARTPEDLLHEMAWLRRLARRLVADPEAADDLAGDTLAAWLTMRAPVRSVRAWLATVLRHRVERHHRREQLRRRGEQNAEAPACAPAADEALATAELHRAVADAVLTLPEPSRSAVVLRYLEDLPLPEVAQRLRVPIETARTRIKRGIEQLRARLDQRYGERGAWALLLLPRSPVPALPSITLLMGTKTLLAVGAIAIAAVFTFLLTQDAPPAPPTTVPTVSTRVDPLLGNQQPPAPIANERQAAAPPSATPAPTASVGGRAVDEATLLPLADVEVTWLSRAAAAPGSAAAVRTGANGRFELTTAAAVPQDLSGVLLRHAERALVTAALGTAPEGGPPLRFDLGDVMMPPGTAVRGTVFDATGGKAPNTALFVCLFSFWTNAGRIVRLEEARFAGHSGADGSFRLDDRLLPNAPPPLLIAAGALGVGYIDLAELRRDRTEVTVDVHLQAPTTLPVRVVDERGRAIVGALVVGEPRYVPLCLPGTYAIHVENVPELAQCFCQRTDADGRATLHPTALPDADRTPYTVRVEAPGRDRHVASVSVPHVDELLVVLPEKQQLTVRGAVHDPAGRAIAGAEVKAHWLTTVSAQTLADGSYSLRVDRGEGPLSIEAAAAHTFAARQQAQPAATATTLELDFTLQPAIELHGNVVDQDNRPVADANVWLADGVVTTTDADGRFHLPVPPASACVLTVQPPEPSGRWLGSIEHLLSPGQSTVTLMLTRHPHGRANLDVELVDAQGKPLEPRHVTLTRTDRSDGVSQPATGTIGHISAGGLTPGEWNLLVEPTAGCELTARFVVQPDVDVDLRLQQATATTVHAEIVFDVGAGQLPATVDVCFGAGSQRARFAPQAGQQSMAHGSVLRLQPPADATFVVTNVDPNRALDLVVDGGAIGGDVQVPRPGSTDVPVRIVVRALARIAVRSPTPLLADRLTLQFKRSGGDWGEAIRFEGLAGRTDLFEWKLAAGEWHWRVLLPTQGDDNRSGPNWREGQFTVTAGGAATVALPN